MSQQSRYESLTHWLSLVLPQTVPTTEINLQPMTGDAGFRRYFRFNHEGRSLIAVDSPIQYCNNTAFIAVQKALLQQGINVPEILYVDENLGFFCISDLGNNLLADVLMQNKQLSSSTRSDYSAVQEFYLQALALIPQISTAKIDANAAYKLPIYDRAFIELELSIFTEWLLEKHLNIHLTTDEKQKLGVCFNHLVESALEQPQVTMHRDFHSRNIMVLEQAELGVIDFQDAVIGPITYDIVSLLRDCYTRWPDEVTAPLFNTFCRLITEQHSLKDVSVHQWQRWFDLMGLQRHLKASGIFCRLFYRDNKSGYLKDIPLTVSYIKDISAKFTELNFLYQLITEKVIPALTILETNNTGSAK